MSLDTLFRSILVNPQSIHSDDDDDDDESNLYTVWSMWLMLSAVPLLHEVTGGEFPTGYDKKWVGFDSYLLWWLHVCW